MNINLQYSYQKFTFSNTIKFGCMQNQQQQCKFFYPLNVFQILFPMCNCYWNENYKQNKNINFHTTTWTKNK